MGFEIKNIKLKYTTLDATVNVLLKDFNEDYEGETLCKNFSTDNLFTPFHINYADAIYMRFKALKDTIDPTKVYWFRDDNLESSRLCGTRFLRNQDVAELDEDRVYEVIVENALDDAVNKLTEQELQQIIDEFNRLDTDKSGHIDKQEVLHYYEDKAEKAIADLRSRIDDDIAKNSGNSNLKDRLEDFFVKKADIFRKLVASNVELLLKADVNRDGKISLQEVSLHSVHAHNFD